MRFLIACILLTAMALAFPGCDAGRALIMAESAAAVAAEKLEIKEEEIAKLRAGLEKAEEMAAKMNSPELDAVVQKTRALYEEAVLALPALRDLSKETKEALSLARANHEAGGGGWQTLGILLGGFIPAAGVALQQYSKAKRESDRATAASAAEAAAEAERRRYEQAATSAARLAQRLKAVAPDAPPTIEALRLAEAEQVATGTQDIIDRVRKL